MKNLTELSTFTKAQVSQLLEQIETWLKTLALLQCSLIDHNAFLQSCLDSDDIIQTRSHRIRLEREKHTNVVESDKYTEERWENNLSKLTATSLKCRAWIITWKTSYNWILFSESCRSVSFVLDRATSLDKVAKLDSADWMMNCTNRSENEDEDGVICTCISLHHCWGIRRMKHSSNRRGKINTSPAGHRHHRLS